MMFGVVLALAMITSAGRPPVLPKGFSHFYNLEYDEAIHDFEQEVAAHPDDPNAHNHLAQGVLYREMLRAGALESEMVTRNNPFLRRPNIKASADSVRVFDENIAQAMKLCQARLAADSKDTRAMYALGVAYGLRANYNFLVRKAWTDSLHDATTARKLHNQISALEPDNIDARLVQGLHDYLIGSLPWQYKVLGFLAGIRGDRDEGMQTLTLVANNGTLNRYDAQILLAAIYRRERMPERAIPLVEQLVARFPRNYLFRLELALMHQDMGDNEKAIAMLDTVERMKLADIAGFRSLPVEKVHYYKATVYFWAHELDRALEEFQRVTPNVDELDLNTEVLTWMRTGQIYDLKGRREQALSAYRKAVALAPNSGPGKESKEYLSSPYRGT
jgi:tetratricopeptide (TPR) repeat protein